MDFVLITKDNIHEVAARIPLLILRIAYRYVRRFWYEALANTNISCFNIHVLTIRQSGGSPSSSFPVHQCTDGTWCCGAETTCNSTISSCCANKQGVSLSTTIGIDQVDAAAMSNTARVSIGCGIAAAILISAGVVGFLAWRKRRARKMEMRAQKEILSLTLSEHGLVPYWEKNGEVVTAPRSARLSC